MDRITISIERESENQGPVFVQVHINDNNMPRILDIEEFFAVKQQNGLVPLFTCGCGVFGCGGYYVDVTSIESALILKNRYHRFNHSLEAAFEYHLDWQQVRSVAEEIVAYLQKIQEYDPGEYITTGYVGVNLLERLPVYRQSTLLNS